MKQISYSARIRHQKGSKSKNLFRSHKLLLWPQYCIFWYFDVVLLISLSTVFDESFTSATYLFRKVNVGLFKKNCFNLLRWKLFKTEQKYFLLHLKSYFRSQDIFSFVLPFWSYRKNQHKYKINFKIYDVTTWLANNYNTHIAQYLTK